MKREYRSLSALREGSPFATPPRVLVIADDHEAADAVALAEELDAIGADTEVRFGEHPSYSHLHPDAVVVADMSGYHVRRHHPILNKIRGITM